MTVHCDQHLMAPLLLAPLRLAPLLLAPKVVRSLYTRQLGAPCRVMGNS